MTYDVIVLGSGPGGYSAAVRAGQYGLKTAIIEKDPRLGGTCLLVGCIPTKAFLHTADVWDRFLHSTEEGIHCENPRLDFPLVSDRKNKIVSKHSKGVEFLMKKNKIDWLKGYGRLAGPGKIEVASDSGTQTYEARNIVIATGSEARMLSNAATGERCHRVAGGSTHTRSPHLALPLLRLPPLRHRRIGQAPIGSDPRRGMKHVLHRPPGLHQVDDVPPSRHQLIGNQPTMTAPRHGFGTHEGRAQPTGEQ